MEFFREVLFALLFLFPGVGLLGAMLAIALALQIPREEFERYVGWLAMAAAFMALGLIETPATLRIVMMFLMLFGVFASALM